MTAADRAAARRLDRQTRIVDVVLGTLGGLVALPVAALISVAVRCSGPGPVLHHSVRIGRDGKPFRLHKFRTMYVGQGETGPGITLAGDRRVTGVGRWLRRSKLDELPQLLNVLAGDMSLVGPRPEDPRYVDLSAAAQRTALSVRPGLTSPASLLFRNESALLTGPEWERTYRSRVLPAKLAIDCDYVAHASLCSHLRVLVLTALTLASRHRGAAAPPVLPDPQ